VLIRFRVENFRSIKEQQEFSLVASSLSENVGSVIPVPRYGINLLPAAAIYGPNASGKSSLFHALAFMRDAVIESQRSWIPGGGIPRVPFALDLASLTDPSVFSVDVLIGNVRYEYGFSVDSTRVLEEWLYAYPKGKRQEWFTRDSNRDIEYTFSRSLPGENRAISTLTRPNSLFLSAAAQNNHELLAPIYQWFSARLWIVDDSTRAFFEDYTVQQCRDERYRASLFAMLQAADLGITNVEFNDEDVSPELEHTFQSMAPEIAEALRKAYGPRVQFLHSTGPFSPGIALPFDQESRGTRTLFSILGILIWSLSSGSTLLIDELDQSLHPELARNIVTHFTNTEHNPNLAQLVFNTHDTNLLGSEILRRDQIWFTEKQFSGATRLYPLTDFHARKHENLERGYLQGRYGATPSLHTPDLSEMLKI